MKVLPAHRYYHHQVEDSNEKDSSESAHCESHGERIQEGEYVQAAQGYAGKKEDLPICKLIKEIRNHAECEHYHEEH